MKFIKFEDMLAEELKNPEFRKEYEALQVEFDLIKEIVKRRAETNMSQAELARRMHSDQATISRYESGAYNPSIKFLKRMAAALDSKIKVSLV